MNSERAPNRVRADAACECLRQIDFRLGMGTSAIRVAVWVWIV